MRNFNNDRGFKNFSDRSFGNNNRGRSFGGNRGGFNRGREDRQMYDAVCDKCGKDCQVPFQPTGEKPIYCSNCFEKTSGRDGSNERNFSGNRDFGGNNRRFESRDTKDYQQDNTRTEIEALNKKMDKIIDLLMAQKPVAPVEKKAKKSKVIDTPVEETQE